jgi:hypothetical protein
MKNGEDMKKHILVLLVATVVLLLTGCAGRDNAEIRRSLEGQGSFFEQQNSKEDYNYYSYNNGSYLIAYLALNKKYTLESKFWQPTKLNAAMWAALPQNQNSDYAMSLNNQYLGMVITSPQSEVIGYIYTRYYRISAWFADPNSPVLTITPPARSSQQPDLDNFRFGD